VSFFGTLKLTLFFSPVFSDMDPDPHGSAFSQFISTFRKALNSPLDRGKSLGNLARVAF
jgi:hypothetical protein